MHTNYSAQCTDSLLLLFYNRDLLNKKRGPVQVRDSTRGFFAYSQKIDNSESFMEIFLMIKVSKIIFIEGG